MNMKHQNTYLFRDILERVEVPVNVEPDKEYVQIGIRSHGKGLFYKEPVLGKALGNKQVFWIQPNCFILNVVFAWEQAITKTTENEIGMIGSHRFPMYRPKNDLVDIDYLIYYFLTKRGTDILEAASPGGAGRNRTLGQERFLKSKITLPPLPEQQKIATILSTQDKVIELKEKLLAQKQQQKKYLMQQLLTGKLRLPDVNGEWASVKLKELLIERNEKNVEQNHRICSVAVSKGVVDQIEHLGRSYAAADTSNYGVAHYGDIIYTRSPTGDFSLGIIKQNRMRENVAISNSAFLENKIFFPMDEATQSRIAKVFELTDHEIDLLQKSIEAEKQKKKALMQLLLTGKVRVKI